MNSALLVTLGLSQNESEVYLALLSLGEASVLELSRKIHKNRTHTYDLLHSLTEKGLVSYVILNNKQFFHAANPERLMGYLNDQENEIKKQKELLKKELPEIIGLQSSIRQKTAVQMYRGKEGIKTIYNEILRSTKSYSILGATGTITQALEFYFPHHEKERVKQKISLKIIFNSQLKGKEISQGRAFCSMRFLPESYSSPVPILLFNDKVVTLIWDELSAVVVENKKVAEAYRKYFELLWKLSQK